MPRLNLVGQKFGRLTVTSFAGAANNGNARWQCQCDCGNTAIVDGYRLRKGMTTSCGCYRREYMKKAIMANSKTRAQMVSGVNLLKPQKASGQRYAKPQKPSCATPFDNALKNQRTNSNDCLQPFFIQEDNS